MPPILIDTNLQFYLHDIGLADKAARATGTKPFDNNLKRLDVDLLCRIAARTDSRIKPIPVGYQQFLADDSSAIIEIARLKGRSFH